MAVYSINPWWGTFTDMGEISPMERMDRMLPMGETKVPVVDTEKVSFLDIFKGLYDNVVETNEQVDKDALDLALGNMDNLAEMQANIEKSLIAVDVLVTVKNEVLSAYNTIINMQI